jgi:PKD repeat protein
MPPFQGIMRIVSPLLVSSLTTALGLTVTTIAIAVTFLASIVTITNAQQQEQLTGEPSAIEIKTTAQSTKDSFRVQVPQGWVINDVNNTGSALIEEVLDGVGILAQLCPELEQQRAAPPNVGDNTSISSNNNHNNSCRGAQEEVIHILRYPNLGPRIGLAPDDVISNYNVTADIILGDQMRKLQEVGYRDISIVDSTDTTVDIDTSTGLNNNTIAATVPAKLVEMTYSTNLAPDQIRKGYFISTATNATPRNLGMITGYAIFYEGTPSTAAEGGEETALPSGSGLILPRPVMEIFDSFELIAAEEEDVVQSTAQEAQAAEEEAQAAATEEEEPANSLTAEINSNDTEGVVPATFEFEADITGGTEPYTIRWDIDDNGIVDSSEETAVPTFNEAGTYNVNLDVTDSMGQTASDNVEITVEEGEGGGAEEEPAANETEETACDSSYPDMCIPPAPPNLNCDDIGARNFEVLPPDPHGFDGDNDGIGCESGGDQPDEDELDNSGSGDSIDIRGLINQAIG